MKSKNSLIYSILWIQAIVFFYLAYKKRQDKRIIVLFFSLTGLAYVFDYFVLVLFKAYRYYPKFFKRVYFDNILGASISQFFIVPAIATLITSLKLKIHWKLLFAVYLMLIEKLFKFLRIYKQFWWKTIYTGVLTFIFFFLSDYLYQVILRELNKPLLKAVTVFLKTFTLYSTYMFYLVVLFNAYFFKVSWFNDGARGHVAAATLYSIFVSTLYTAIVVLRKNLLLLSSAVSLLSLDVMLVKLKVLNFKGNNNLIKFKLRRFLFLYLLYKADEKIYQNEANDQV